MTSNPNSFDKPRHSQGSYDARIPSPLSLTAYDPRSSTSHFDLRGPPPTHSSSSSTSSASSFSSYDQRPIASYPPHLSNSNPPLAHPPHDSFSNDFTRASAHDFARSHGDADASADAHSLPRQTSARDIPKNAYEDRPLPTSKHGAGGQTPRNHEFDAPAHHIEDRPIKVFT